MMDWRISRCRESFRPSMKDWRRIGMSVIEGLGRFGLPSSRDTDLGVRPFATRQQITADKVDESPVGSPPIFRIEWLEPRWIRLEKFQTLLKRSDELRCKCDLQLLWPPEWLVNSSFRGHLAEIVSNVCREHFLISVLLHDDWLLSREFLVPFLTR